MTKIYPSGNIAHHKLFLKNQDTTVTWKKQCYNCKKFWYS